jgi:hypothetical protein
MTMSTLNDQNTVPKYYLLTEGGRGKKQVLPRVSTGVFISAQGK